MSDKIIVEIHAGIATVTNPTDEHVEVRDYDVQNDDPDEILYDEAGEPYFLVHSD